MLSGVPFGTPFVSRSNTCIANSSTHAFRVTTFSPKDDKIYIVDNNHTTAIEIV